MSSYINSLLVELGFRAPHHPEAEPSRGDPQSTKLPNDRIPSPDQDRIASNIPGDAGSPHGPPFFTTLLKDMDRRTSDRERQRPRSTQQHDDEFPNRSVPVTANTTDRPFHTDMEVQRNLENIRLHDDESRVLSPEEQSGGDAPSLRGSGSESESPSSRQNHNTDGSASTSLPADDGMGWLRKKIHAIRDRDLDNNEKARMVHDLMTEKYKSSRTTLSPALSPPTLSPSGILESRESAISPGPTLDTSTPHENRFSLTAEDLQPTYVPRIEPESPVAETAEEAGDEDPDTEELEEASPLGCQHYKRNVKLQCFTCKKWYTCRFCHDEIEDHPLVRRDTENMLCMLCGCAQPAAQNCQQCGEQTAQYYCDICKLWDNDSKKSIYHCHDCGICRIGQGLGKDFFHCKVSTAEQSEHSEQSEY